MQTYDLIMLIVLAIAILTGFIKGLVWQVASIASLFASYLVAFQYGDSLARWLPVSRPWNMVFAMLLLFLVTAAAIWFICQLVRDWLDRMKLKAYDRQIGGLLGLAKGLLLCTLITAAAVTLFGPTARTAVARSYTGRLMGVFLDRCERVLPPEINEALEPFLRAVERRLQQGEAGRPEVGSRSIAAGRLGQRFTALKFSLVFGRMGPRVRDVRSGSVAGELRYRGMAAEIYNLRISREPSMLNRT